MYQHPGKRPVYINLAAFRFPLNAYVSILHRITGVLLSLGIMAGLIWLNWAILRPESFTESLALLQHPISKILISGFLVSLWFHWLSGLRHLLIEHNVWDTLKILDRSRLTAKIMLIIFALGALWILLEVWV